MAALVCTTEASGLLSSVRTAPGSCGPTLKTTQWGFYCEIAAEMYVNHEKVRGESGYYHLNQDCQKLEQPRRAAVTVRARDGAAAACRPPVSDGNTTTLRTRTSDYSGYLSR